MRRLAWLLGVIGLACGCNAMDTLFPPPPPFRLDVDPNTVQRCEARPLGAGEARAKPVACAEELIGGTQAAGQVGDYLLENDRIRVILQAPGPSFTTAGLAGGNILDADIVRAPGEAGQDLLREHNIMVGWMAVDAEQMGVTGAGGGGTAQVRVIGRTLVWGFVSTLLPALENMNLEVAVDYSLAAGSDTVDIHVQAINRDSRIIVAPVGGAMLLVGGALEPFRFRGIDSGPIGPSDGVVLAGAPVSYAFVFQGGGGETLVSDSTVVPFRFVSLLNINGVVEFSDYFAVGPGGAAEVAASAQRALGAPVTTASGQVAGLEGPPLDPAFVTVTDPGGRWQARLDVASDGSFSGPVPAGDLVFSAVGAGRADGPATPLTVGGSGLSGAALTALPAGRVEAIVTDGLGALLPSRLVVTSELDTVPLAISYSAGEPHAVALAPGRYRLVASHGPEWTRQSIVTDVGGGAVTPLAFALAPAIDTTGYVAADFHVHSEMSPDGLIVLDARVRSLLSEGLEYVVATEHDFLADYAPALAALGLSGSVATTIGEEVSTTNIGHFNAWPLTPDPNGPGNGAVVWFGKSPAEILTELAGMTPRGIVEINHPRDGLLNAIGFDRTTGRATADPTALNLAAGTNLDDFTPFQALEVWNAIVPAQNEEALADAMNLWSRGYTFAMTGNSDSHQTWHPMGMPRTYVAVTPDTVAAATDDAVTAGLKSGNVTVSSGAFVTMEADGLPLGSVVTVAGGLVDLHVRVQAPPWVALDTLRIYSNEAVVFTAAIDPLVRTAVRFDQIIPLAVVADAWVLARADGPGPIDELASWAPAGLTNPIFLDADGNRRFDPPLPR